jgi:hypothetical protein
VGNQLSDIPFIEAHVPEKDNVEAGLLQVVSSFFRTFVEA